MRKSDNQLIQDFLIKHDLRWLEKEVRALCMQIHCSGWVDGSNDHIEDYDEEE